MPKIYVTTYQYVNAKLKYSMFGFLHACDPYCVRYRTRTLIQLLNILISEINKYLCLIIQYMKNVHIIIAILLVSLVVLDT